MKYTKTFIITLFFLISLINLKKPQLNLKSFLSIPLGEADDAEKCLLGGTDKNECQAVKLTSNNNQCCLTTTVTSKETEEQCTIFPSPAKSVAEMVKTKEYGAYSKEFTGFVLYSLNKDTEDEKEKLEEIKMKNTISCKDAEVNINIGYEEYSEEEKNIFKSEDYCLNYYIEDMSTGFQGKHDCKNGKVLDSSKSMGFECGNMEIKVKIQGQSQKFKTCFLYSYEFYSKYSSELLNQQFSEIFNFNYEGIDSYTITFSDSNGENRISIDSDSS